MYLPARSRSRLAGGPAGPGGPTGPSGPGGPGGRPCLLRGNVHISLFRRQLGPKEINILNKMPIHVGPKRTSTYDPTFGYEQYWAGGEWVFDPVERKEGDMCGTRCNIIMSQYGKVCGRDRDYKHETFDNYCAMKNKDCNGTQGWLIAYRGECKPYLSTYPTKAKRIVTRANQWISKFTAKYTRI